MTAKKACVGLYVSNQGTGCCKSSLRDLIMWINLLRALAFQLGFEPGPPGYKTTAVPLSHSIAPPPKLSCDPFRSLETGHKMQAIT